jgi:hypothetical protein
MTARTRVATLALCSLLVVVATAARAQPSAFDGRWKASMASPATNASEGAKCYAYDLAEPGNA